MHRIRMLCITTLAMLCVGIALTMTDALAQGTSKVDTTKLVGDWTLVSVNNTFPDAKTVQSFGPNDGIMVFGANGRFVEALARPDIPNFASNNRNTGSSDENKAVVQGSVMFFGTYTVSEDGTLTLHIERSTFPNWNGTVHTRTITSLTADELKWHNPLATVGGTTETTWKRTR